MNRISELLKKRFLTENEVIDIEKCNNIDYVSCGCSGIYPDYKWDVIIFNSRAYVIYYK